MAIRVDCMNVISIKICWKWGVLTLTRSYPRVLLRSTRLGISPNVLNFRELSECSCLAITSVSLSNQNDLDPIIHPVAHYSSCCFVSGALYLCFIFGRVKIKTTISETLPLIKYNGSVLLLDHSLIKV